MGGGWVADGVLCFGGCGELVTDGRVVGWWCACESNKRTAMGCYAGCRVLLLKYLVYVCVLDPVLLCVPTCALAIIGTKHTSRCMLAFKLCVERERQKVTTPVPACARKEEKDTSLEIPTLAITQARYTWAWVETRLENRNRQSLCHNASIYSQLGGISFPLSFRFLPS